MYLDNWVAAAAILPIFLFTVIVSRTTTGGKFGRAALFCGLYAIGVGYLLAATHFDWFNAATLGGRVTGVFGWLTLIELFAILCFKIFLPRIGINPPSIVGDLFLGGAFIVLAMVLLNTFGVDATGIAATSAVLTGILAISLQATLGNVIGGVALQLDRSIRVGDWIQLENGTQGRVQEIHWRHTVVETREWDTIIVPNATLLAANIMILGKREGCPVQHRMWVNFNVDFRYHPHQVIETIEKALRASPPIPGVAVDPPANCVCLDFAKDNRESYCLYAVRFWLTDLSNDDPTSSLVRQRVFAALRRAGIPLAIPAAQLFVDQDTQERRDRKIRHDLKERLSALESIAFLTMLNEEESKKLANSLQPVYYAECETIMRQNDKADWLYVMTEGSAEVVVNAGDGQHHVSDLKAPTFFGEMGLMTGTPRAATIIATDAVSCYRLYRDSFQEILEQRPKIAKEISRILAARQVEMESVRDQLDAESHSQRVEQASSNLLGKISTFFGLSH